MPLNIAHDFTATTHLDLDGDPYSLATPALLIHVYDTQVLATRLTPGLLAIAPTAPYNVDIDFAQPTAGYLAIHPARPATGTQCNYGAPLTVTDPPYTATILGTTHQLLTKALLIDVYDTAGRRVEPGLVQVHTTTFDVTLTFAQPFSGRVVICGGYGTGTPGLFAVGAASTTWTIAATTHALGTDRLLLATFTEATPAVQIEPGTVTVEADTDVVVTFAQALTGTVVLDGSVQTASLTVPVSTGTPVLATPTVRLSTRLSLTTGPVLAATVALRLPLLRLAPTTALALTTTVTLRLPVLRLQPSTLLTLGTSVVFGATLATQVSTGTPLGTLASVRLPVLSLAVSTGVVPLATPTLALSLRRSVTTTLSLMTTVTLRLPVLLVQPTTGLALGTLTLFGSTLATQMSTGTTLGTHVSLSLPVLPLAVSTGVSVLASPTLGLRAGISVSTTLALATALTIRLPVLRLDATTGVSLGTLTLFGSTLGAQMSTSLALDTLVSLYVPRLPLAVSTSLPLMASAVMRLRSTVPATTTVSVGTMLTVRLPVLPLTASTTVALTDTLVVPGLRLAASVQESLAVSTAPAVHVPRLLLSVSTGVSLNIWISFSGRTSFALAQMLPLADTVAVTGLREVVTASSLLSVQDTPTVRGLRVPVQAAETLAAGAALAQVALGIAVHVSTVVPLGTVLTRHLLSYIQTTEALPVAVSVTPHLPLPTSASAGVSVSDTTTVAPLLLSPQVQETVGLGTLPTVHIPVLYLQVEARLRVIDPLDIWPPYLPGLMILDDMALLLEEAALGTQAVSIFKGGIPPDVPQTPVPDAVIGLVELPGLPDVLTHAGSNGRVEQPQVQVVIRGNPHDYQGARATAHQAWSLLDHIANQRLNGTWYLWVKSNMAPYWLKTDEMNRPHIVFTIRAAKEPAKV